MDALVDHCVTKSIKAGTIKQPSLTPVPSVAAKPKDVGGVRGHEGDGIDERQMEIWVRQTWQLFDESCF